MALGSSRRPTETAASRRRMRDGTRGQVDGLTLARPQHFGLLLVVLVGTFLTLGFAHALWARVLAGIFELLIVLAGASTGLLARSASWNWVLVALAATAIAIGQMGTTKWAFGVGSLLFALVVIVLLRGLGHAVLGHEHVTLQTLFAAVCAYMLLGILFGAIYAVLDSFGSAPLFGENVAHSVYSYFSFTTITTLGFGDYTVKTDLGRRVVALEAITGQTYIAVALARLVALYRRPDRTSGGSNASS